MTTDKIFHMYENQTKGDFLMNKNGKVISLFLAITLGEILPGALVFCSEE